MAKRKNRNLINDKDTLSSGFNGSMPKIYEIFTN